jgi:hypothetical protein
MPSIEVLNIMFVSDDVVWISWKYSSEELVPSLRHTNEVIGVFVTAGASIHLYSYLDRLRDNESYCDTDSIITDSIIKDKAIYYDTDSVIHVQPADEPSLVETGDKLGATASEFKANEIICEVVCADPKNYAYRTVNTMTAECKTICKVRVITLNFSASKLVNFAKMKEMILSTDADETVTVRTKNKIKRTRCNGE